MSTRRIAIYGGSFDPPHVAHVLASTYVLTTQPIDEVWWIPVYQHAFDSKSELTPFEDRIAMCEHATELLGPRAVVLPVERDLGGVSRTVDTIRHLMREHPDCEFRLVIGTDVLPETHLWKDFDQICELAPPIILGRRGYPAPDGTEVSPPLPNINSGDIRKRLRRNQTVDGLLPNGVRRYIRARQLYGARETP